MTVERNAGPGFRRNFETTSGIVTGVIAKLISTGTMDWTIISRELKYSFSRPSITNNQRSYLKETRVKLQFNIAKSKGLTDEEKALALAKFDHITSTKGVLSINAERDPSQGENKTYVTHRLHDMLTELYKPKPKRKATVRPTLAVEDRIHDKKAVSARKVARRKPEL
jgi:ribosome-associated protein